MAELETDYIPIGNNVLILPDPRKGIAEGGRILLPDQVDNPSRTGRVVAVGTGKVTKKKKFIPLDISVGEHILFNHEEARSIRIKEVDYLIIDGDHCFGSIELD